MITLQHGVLRRKQALANGGKYCDCFITGDKECPCGEHSSSLYSPSVFTNVRIVWI